MILYTLLRQAVDYLYNKIMPNGGEELTQEEFDQYGSIMDRTDKHPYGSIRESGGLLVWATVPPGSNVYTLGGGAHYRDPAPGVDLSQSQYHDASFPNPVRAVAAPAGGYVSGIGQTYLDQSGGAVYGVSQNGLNDGRVFKVVHQAFIAGATAYAPVFPPLSEFPEVMVDSTAYSFPPGTLLSPALLAALCNAALEELYQENSAEFVRPFTGNGGTSSGNGAVGYWGAPDGSAEDAVKFTEFAFKPSDFDGPVTGRDLGETLTNRPVALDYNDTSVRNVFDDLIPPRAPASPPTSSPPFPGDTRPPGASDPPPPPPTGGGGDTGGGDTGDGSFTLPGLPSADWAMLPDAEKVDVTFASSCPPIVLGGQPRTDHCDLMEPVTPKIRGILGALAPLIVAFSAMGGGRKE